MNPLISKESWIVPEVLFLCWYNLDSCLYHKVGEIVPSDEVGMTLTYLTEDEDYTSAYKEGFRGYPAFPIREEPYLSAEDCLSSRVIQKGRGDFNRFLSSWRIDSNLVENLSVFNLLAITEGRLPRDHFAFLPYWTSKKFNKLSLMTLIQKTYDCGVTEETLSIGEKLSLKEEGESYTLLQGNEKVGYVNSILEKQIAIWKSQGRSLECEVARLNGEESPKVYLNIQVQ